MFDKLIRHTNPFYLRSISVISHKFQNSTAQSTFDYAVFNSDDTTEPLTDFMQQFFIHRF